MSTTWIFLLIYLLIQLLIGYWISRRIRTDADYFLAGRSLSIPFATLSIFATWFGAETCIGAASAIYEKGLSGGRADPFGYTICLVLMSLFLAHKLRSLELVTIGDLFRISYSPVVEKVAVLVMLPSTILWAAAQVRALGQIVTVMSPLSMTTACTLASIFIILYTFMGGLMGDVIHDVVQSLVLFLGLATLLWVSMDHLGGVQVAWSKIEASRFSFVAPGETWLSRFDSWMVPILGSLVAQELISRVLACRSASVARTSSLLAAGVYFVVGGVPVLMGLLGPQLAQGMEHNDQYLPMVAQQLLHPALFVLFMGGLVAAILSTVDSTLLTISALFTHNILSQKFYSLSESNKVKFSRGTVVVAGIVAYLISIGSQGIYQLLQLASSIGTSGILIITFAALYWKKSQQIWPALCCLLAGLVSFPLAQYYFECEAPYLVSIACSLLAFILGHLIEGQNFLKQQKGIA